MTGAEDTSISPAAWGISGNAAAPAGMPPRHRLFRKYALLLVALVAATLLITSGFDFWFSYQENKAALVHVQQEKAQAAATRIEAFVGEIERQIGWTTHAQWASGSLDQRRQDYFRLLRQVPAITELAELDGEGKEQLRVSRLSMDVVGSGKDFSQSPEFTEAKAHHLWFSPVYFRKQSEPYMTMAVARDGRNAGVTVAEINLKLIWDVITGLKIGEGGYAYVVDRRGRLIAHPDISLVLRDTDLAKLPQVAAALGARPEPQAGGHAVTVAHNLAGRSVLTAHAAIAPLGWLVFVEVPLNEAFAPLYGAAIRTALLLAFGLVAAALVALGLARRMTGPIRAIAAGAERIGQGELDRRIDIHTGDELEALAGQFNRMAGDLQQSYAELEQRVADRTAELSEALDQQTATAEVLGVINASPGDLAPVFEAIVDKAHALCDAAYGSLQLWDGEMFWGVAMRGFPEGMIERLRAGYSPQGMPCERIVAGDRVAHCHDLAEVDSATARRGVELGGIRTVLYVALRKDEALLGQIVAVRREVRPFSEKEIALVENFAAQAVIAMENARLITETREALDQQTATAEVLGVINASPGDLQPVFDVLLDKAMQLCGAAFGVMTVIGDGARTVASRGMPAALAEFRRHNSPHGSLLARVLAGEAFVHTVDLKDDVYRRGDPLRRAMVDLGGARTSLYVALRRDRNVLGAIHIYRREVRPFSDKQIALLQNFAAQAVIAIENARLITETREALEQQTATAEVLQVINSSPGDLAPVFDAMLEKAVRLSEAVYGHLWRYDGEFFHPWASHGVPRFAEWLAARGPVRPNPDGDGFLGRIVRGERVLYVADVRDTDAYRADYAPVKALADVGGGRSVLTIALRQDDAVLGVMTVYRQEVRPFSDRQIALLENFAAQAVIAMENARLLTETRERTRDLQESLEYQTATSDVLKVMSNSAFDLAPVLDTVVGTAVRLCRADAATIYRLEDGEYRWDAASGEELLPEFAAIERTVRIPPGAGTLVGRVALAHDTVQILDCWNDPAYEAKDNAKIGGIRTLLGVPLMRDGAPIGVIGLARRRVEAYSEKEIELVRTFADQAVIAIENARLLNELRERTRDLQESLEYQTATSDVLKVISQSTFDLEPVLMTVTETAARLCDCQMAFIFQREGELYRLAASVGFPEAVRAVVQAGIAPGRGTTTGRAALTKSTVHIPDARSDPEYTWSGFLAAGGTPTMLSVPLLRGGEPVGVITLGRERVEPFTDKQIGLVTTFADQAVIAIENARLFNELRARTDELARSVEELQALGEVGQAVSSTLDLGAVLSTILNRSVALAEADAGAIFRYRRAARAFRLFDAVGWEPVLVGQVRALTIAEDATGMGEATARRAPLQIADLASRPGNPLRDATVAAGYHAVLIVPLVGADRAFGAIVLQRRAAGEFPEATVRLMQTIAAQSVLAIQNARLFNEIAEKSEQLAEASRHKSQFLANMSHELRTPLNAILGYTELMADGIYGELAPRAAGVLERVQNNGKHLLALINDVLDLAKIEAGQLTMQLEDYAMPDVVRSVVNATEGLANTKGLKFTAEIAAGLPTGHGDARRLSQVLLNLVGNAVKFTDEGEVAIAATAEDGHFVLTVRDTGPGIAPEDQAKIFEEFQQVDDSNTRKKGGTGLGLAISKRMVEMQGGTISVASVPGHGATFRVTLPVRVEEAAGELAGELMGAA